MQNDTTAVPGVLGTRIPATVVFAIGVLLFLFPFAELRCVSDKKEPAEIMNYAYGSMAFSNTGLGLALGSKWHSQFDALGSLDAKNNTNKSRRMDPNMFAILSLSLGVFGFCCSLLAKKPWGYLAIAAGILASAALVALMLDLMNKTSRSPADLLENGADLNDMRGTKLKLQFTPWFYVVLASFAIASFFSYKRVRIG